MGLTDIPRHTLLVAQYLKLRSQIPPLYLLLSTNAAALAFTHRTSSPPLLVYVVPSVLIIGCLVRMIFWLRPPKPADLNDEAVARKMRITLVLTVLFSAAYVTWALVLAEYGPAAERAHAMVFITITVMGCVFCLSYLPRAAVLVCLVVLVPLVAYCAWRGDATSIAIAVNFILAVAMILKVLQDSFAAFVQLEASQGELEAERLQAQRLSEENARMAESDFLTGLPNRRHFFACLEAMLQRDAGKSFCVGVIDLDRFKPINDSLGHMQGDRLLQSVGQRLVGFMTEGVSVARLGGDEFGVLFDCPVDEAEAIGQTICAAIAEPVQLGDTAVSVGASMGLSEFNDAGTGAEQLFDRADFALYHSKKIRRGGCVRFSAALERLIHSEQAVETALHSADLDRELDLVYQPVFKTQSLSIYLLEALARWTSPTLGPVTPEALFQAAERAGTTHTVTLTLFAKVFAALQHIPDEINVSFNLSATDVANRETIDHLCQRMAANPEAAGRLVFEITEASLITDFATARTSLEALRAHGAHIALDDFGTGYSSLSTLHELPLDVVKIDRSFAARLDDPAGRRMVGAIREVARALRLECVFEGIETDRQLVEATLAGFRFVQGYYLARPAPLADILELCGGNAVRPAA